jgi:hypothetical protein
MPKMQSIFKGNMSSFNNVSPPENTCNKVTRQQKDKETKGNARNKLKILTASLFHTVLLEICMRKHSRKHLHI